MNKQCELKIRDEIRGKKASEKGSKQYRARNKQCSSSQSGVMMTLWNKTAGNHSDGIDSFLLFFRIIIAKCSVLKLEAEPARVRN